MARKPSKKQAAETLPPFERSLEELQEIIDAIEGGEVSLEQSLDQYTRGVKLIQHCRGILDQAESRIQKLTVEEGKLKEAGAVRAEEMKGSDE